MPPQRLSCPITPMCSRWDRSPWRAAESNCSVMTGSRRRISARTNPSIADGPRARASGPFGRLQTATLAYTNYCFSSADEQVVVGCQCFRDRTPAAPCGTCDERDGSPRLVGQVWAQGIRRHGGSVGVAVGSVLWLLLAGPGPLAGRGYDKRTPKCLMPVKSCTVVVPVRVPCGAGH